MQKEILILIPARYASTRFPGKPLAMIDGVSMIKRVYRSCVQTGFTTCVVTDSAEIEGHVKEFGQVCRVDDEVSSGSERIALAYERFFKSQGREFDYIINVQGDEPLIQADLLSELAKAHISSDFDIMTVVRAMPFADGFEDPNRVKAIWNEHTLRCHYFSRSPIPFDRSGQVLQEWFLHIGIYSYQVESLFKFLKLEQTFYDQCEQLEQLRALEHGMTIGAIKTELQLLGVDSLKDIKDVEGVLRGKK